MKNSLLALMGKRAKRAADPDDPEKDEDETAAGPEDEDEEEGAETEVEDEDESAADAEDEDEDEPVAGDKEKSRDYRAGLKAGVRRERRRTATVLGDPKAKGREGQAAMLLAGSNMSPAKILGILPTFAKSGGLSAAMDKIDRPDLGPSASAPAGTKSLADLQRERIAARAESRRR
ncbi:hypothetical protein [Pacificispira sp.]|uniref:hypothetical protein n=1 Tax=Pacificispira sp. TaxID=2888761 RepID=UPI003BA8AB5F